jgi:hypothetical protein
MASIGIRVSEHDHARFSEAAQRTGMSLSQRVREVLEEALGDGASEPGFPRVPPAAAVAAKAAGVPGHHEKCRCRGCIDGG